MEYIITGQELADRVASKVRTPAIPYHEGGRSDKGTDCINLIGWCLDELEARTVQRGSNSSWRKDYEWRGTLAEAKSQGKLLPGAVLYIDYNDHPGGSDGTDGKMDHAGVYVGMEYGLKTPEGKLADVVHASSSRGGVYSSTLKNGWTHAALLKGVEYGASTEAIAPEPDTAPVTSTTTFPLAEPKPGQAKIVTNDKKGLNLRKAPDRKAGGIKTMPDNTIVDVLDTQSGWALVRYVTKDGMPHKGWCSAEYLQFGGGVD